MNDTKILKFEDKQYPSLLKEISNPPERLYYKGDINILNDFCIAIVGTRLCSDYGREATRLIVKGLVESGIIIVSGLAYGIDEEAHKKTLELGGKTIAVLGSGLDDKSIYPPRNKKLAEEIVKSGGLLLSEFPEGMVPLPQNFPQRNRIISGLSKGVVVMEAKEKSGALITAKFALEQNREVFALPGPIFNLNSFGPNELIKSGAKIITSCEDILNEFELTHDFAKSEKSDIINLTNEEKTIFNLLKNEPLEADEIIRKINLESNKVLSILSLLEIKNFIKKLDKKYYIC